MGVNRYLLYIIMLKNLIYISTFLLLAALVTASCGKQEVQSQSDNLICLSVVVPQTKATVFDTDASLTNPAVGGGSFAISSFVAGTGPNSGKLYMDNVGVSYFSAAKDWRFTDANGIYVNYYWPVDEKLDFFAYFPKDPSLTAVHDVNYTFSGGPSFEFTLPLHSYDKTAAYNQDLVGNQTPNQEELHEFLYAYVKDQDINTQNSDPQNPGVKLSFAHPFASVRFDLGTAYRMTLHDIIIEAIKYKGKYDCENDSWSLNTESSIGDLLIDVEKGIPVPINFNGPIGGPYLVCPQDLSGVKLTVKYTRLDGQAEQLTKTVDLATASVGTWEAGKLYTYTISLGNTEEEILFKVKVEDWKVIDYMNDIVVE